jgi:putative spermidine/putrescine transport system substrate-binding protein
MPRPSARCTRRRFLLGSATAVAAAPFVLRPSKARAAERLVLVSFGGSLGEFLRDEWNKPFAAETGIEVTLATGPDLARAKAQVMSKNVEWDIFDGAGSTVFAGSKEGLWEPLDPAIVNRSRSLVKSDADRMPVFMYSGGVAFDPARTKPPARNFQEFWDVAKFPGRRGLRTRVSETLEMALLADGVDPARLYPLDLDRAFKALGRIKKHVAKWFDQTTQGITLIQTNEADYTYTYANRVKVAKQSGISIDFSLDQTINAMDYFVVLRGSPRKQAAMRYLEFVTRPDRQAAMSERLSFGPVTKGALEKVSAESRRWLPNVANPKSIVIDDEYWRDRYVETDKRFKEWILT